MRRAFILLLALIPLTATARIGENKEAILNRYGKPHNARIGEEKKLSFLRGEFTITIEFTERKSSKETFRRTDGKPLSAEEIDRVIAAVCREAPNYHRSETMKSPREGQAWRIGDLQDRTHYYAYCDGKSVTFGSLFVIYTPDVIDKLPPGL